MDLPLEAASIRGELGINRSIALLPGPEGTIVKDYALAAYEAAQVELFGNLTFRIPVAGKHGHKVRQKASMLWGPLCRCFVILAWKCKCSTSAGLLCA